VDEECFSKDFIEGLNTGFRKPFKYIAVKGVEANLKKEELESSREYLIGKAFMFGLILGSVVSLLAVLLVTYLGYK
jgi:hypothetical protein